MFDVRGFVLVDAYAFYLVMQKNHISNELVAILPSAPIDKKCKKNISNE